MIELADVYPLALLAICVWREARGESIETKTAVACSIRNRVSRPGWWGHNWTSVILMPWQYSSFNANDPNSRLLPHDNDPSWEESLNAAYAVYCNQVEDTTQGADSYFDRSLDQNPPAWATDGTKTHTVDSGRLHFYRTMMGTTT